MGLRLRVPELHPAQGLRPPRPHAPSFSSCALSSLPGPPGWARPSFSLAHTGLVFPARSPGPSGWRRKQDLKKIVLDWKLQGNPELRRGCLQLGPSFLWVQKGRLWESSGCETWNHWINSSLSLVWDPSSFWGGAGRTRKGSMHGVHEKCLKQLFLCGSGGCFSHPSALGTCSCESGVCGR